jgi:diketogulonate reductase-like aldo/keto reductase
MAAAVKSFAFDVLGQKGTIPSIGFGTATLFKEQCTQAVRAGG